MDFLALLSAVTVALISGGFLEFLIPLDEENHREGDPISDHHKEIYDRYVANESRVKPAVAELLSRWLEAEGRAEEGPSPGKPDEILREFDFSFAAIPEDLAAGAQVVELHLTARDRSAEVPDMRIDLHAGELRFAD